MKTSVNQSVIPQQTPNAAFGTASSTSRSKLMVLNRHEMQRAGAPQQCAALAQYKANCTFWMCFLVCILPLATSCSAAPKPPACASSQERFDHTLCTFTNEKRAYASSDSSDGDGTQRDAGGITMYWWDVTANQPFYTFDNLAKALAKREQKLMFAINAGMYDAKYAPLAYYVEDTRQVKSLNQKRQGGGNFHLTPNGVYWIDKSGISHVTETHAFADNNFAKKARYATQSGPMLVINGDIHPKFNPDSQSLKIRNGVGVCKDGTVKFAISNKPVNFYQFAQLFKQDLGCNDALFLDGGRASALYASELNRNDAKYMGVMIGVSQPATP